MTEAVAAIGDQSAETQFRVAVVDDALDPLAGDALDAARLATLLENIETSDALSGERDTADLPFHSVSDATPEIFERILADDTSTPLIAGALRTSFDAELRERAQVLQLVRELEEFGAEVRRYGVRDLVENSIPTDDLDVVFLDYFLGPPNDKQREERSVELAKTIVSKEAPAVPLVVLMSSRIDKGSASSREGRIGVFKRESKIPGPAFVFAVKTELVGAWQAQVYCEVARSTTDVRMALGRFAAALAEALVNASKDLIERVSELELSDYAYLQRLKLENDGHPFGDYLAWLYASRFASHAFDNQLRGVVTDVNRARFEGMVPSHMPPSERVAEMYEAGLFEQNLGPLGPHPRAKPSKEGDPAPPPMVLLGDTFHSVKNLQVVMVASGDCDLTSAPDTGKRVPSLKRAIMLIPGTLIPIGQKGAAKAFRTDLFTIETQRYAIEWEFDKWTSVHLGELLKWLESGDFDSQHYRRFRPLFGLAIQQAQRDEHGQIGLPLSPPLFRKLRGKAVWVSPSGAVRDVCDLQEGDCVVARLVTGDEPENFYINASVAATLHAEMKSNSDSDVRDETEEQNAIKAKSVQERVGKKEKWVGLANGSKGVKWKEVGKADKDVAGLPLSVLHCGTNLEIPADLKFLGMVLLLQEPIASISNQPEVTEAYPSDNTIKKNEPTDIEAIQNG